jgi:hypothetical protein
MNDAQANALYGEFRLDDGSVVKWSFASAGLFVVSWDNGTSNMLIKGAHPTRQEMQAAIDGYRQGENNGAQIGRRQLAVEIRRLLNIT